MNRISAIRMIAILVLGLGGGISHEAFAQSSDCGPLAHWTGQTCVGPKGKLYCPQGMTMQGQTCVSEQTPLSRVMPAPSIVATTPVSEIDHQRIIAMLTNLTNLATAQQVQISQQGEMLKALQLEVTMAMNNAEKARVAAVNAGSAMANMQTSIANLQATATATATNVTAIQGKLGTLFVNVAQLNNENNAEAATLKDVQHRQALICHMVSELAPELQSATAAQQGNACNGTFWYPNVTQEYLNQAIPFKY